MNLAIAHNPQSDSFAAWQAANGAAWCRRLSATISHATCKANQHSSNHKFGDFRCQGCGGLDNQDEPQSLHPALAFKCDANSESGEAAVTDDGGDCVEVSAPDQRGSALDDEELDDFLAEMFPIDDQDDADGEDCREWAYIEDPPEPSGRRVPVYVGRCARCGTGYMSNVLETQFDTRDFAVYRCHSCGWRTSPQYENNRALFAAGGVI